MHHSVSDPKYEGVKTSRRDLMDSLSEEEWDSEGDESEAVSISPSNQEDVGEQSGPDGSSSIRRSISQSPIAEDGPTSALQTIRDDDRQKGTAIRKQIVRPVVYLFFSVTVYIYKRRFGTIFSMPASGFKNLLQARIDFHRYGDSASDWKRITRCQNDLPQVADSDLQSVLHKVYEEAVLLSEEFFSLQEV